MGKRLDWRKARHRRAEPEGSAAARHLDRRADAYLAAVERRERAARVLARAKRRADAAGPGKNANRQTALNFPRAAGTKAIPPNAPGMLPSDD